MGTYLGQNFLINTQIQHYIADHISALYGQLGCEALIEIGLGRGAITKLIKDISPNFFVIEMDKTLSLSDIKIIYDDVLKTDTKKIYKPEKTLIVGNLPYYITSPILRKFFSPAAVIARSVATKQSGSTPYPGGICMIQHEVAEKIQTDTQKKSFLRRLINYNYDIKYLKGVPAKCFKPAPKVKSAIIQLTAKNEKTKIDFEKVKIFLDEYAAFSRKTLGAISTMLAKKGKNNFTIPEELKKKRLEELNWEDLQFIGE